MNHRNRRRRFCRHVELLEPRQLLSSYVWTGAASSLFSDSANWAGGVSPAGDNNAALHFPASGVSRFTVEDDLTSTTFASIHVGGGGYVFTSAGDATMFISGNLKISAPAATADTFQLPLSSGGSLISSGPGKVSIGSASFVNTTVEGGKLVVGTLAGPVTMIAGKLLGPGSIGNLTAESGSKISPSNGSDPGILSDNGDLDLAAGAIVLIHLNGANNGGAASGFYDQLAVSGSVNLDNATLNVSLGFASAEQDQFVIVNNLGGAPVNGTFSGLAQGAVFIGGGVPFQMNYHGGDGNDVVLTRLAISATRLQVDNANPIAGMPINFTANATIDGSSATTGTINFLDGTTLLASEPVNSSGFATLNTAALGPSDHSITAQFTGNATSGPSASDPISVNVTSGVQIVGQTVYVGGTSGADSIDVFPLDPDIVISVNGQVTDIPAANVQSFVISTFGGNDVITIQAGVPPALVNGGGGADSISAANGNDTLQGGGGPDTIQASAGNDILDGGRGADKLISLAGDDVINGNGGDDTIFALNGVQDTLFGGPGNDTAHVDLDDPVTDLIPNNDIETILTT